MAEKSKPKAKKAARPKTKKPAASKAAAKKPVAAPRAKKKSAKPRAAPRRASSASSTGFDIGKLIDHPLVADLLAVGAMAAVAAIAEHSVKTRTGEREAGSSRAVKSAGKAAAAAIGKRLLTEVNEVRKASKPKATKRAPK